MTWELYMKKNTPTGLNKKWLQIFKMLQITAIYLFIFLFSKLLLFKDFIF